MFRRRGLSRSGRSSRSILWSRLAPTPSSSIRFRPPRSTARSKTLATRGCWSSLMTARSPNPALTTFTLTKPRFAGATEWVAKTMNGKGNMLLVTGVPGTDTDTQRSKGIKDALAKYPDIKMIGSVNGMWSLAVVEKVISEFMATHKWSEIDGIVGAGGGWTAWQQETRQGSRTLTPYATDGANATRVAMLPVGQFPMRQRPMRPWAGQACPSKALRRPERWRSNWH